MNQCVVWMDRTEARIFELRDGAYERLILEAPKHHVRRLSKEEQIRSHNHPNDEQRFFRELVAALREQGEILLVGPSTTKLRFFRFARDHEKNIEARVVGLETADHPTDGQIVAHARRYFASSSPN